MGVLPSVHHQFQSTFPFHLTMGIRKPISAAESKPLDLSHHLSTEARERTPNPMKAIWKVAQSRPGAISLANGALIFVHITYNVLIAMDNL